jgi:adenine C2-methylase RlmN of 23S rRNA A2503 and tRNA A37
MVTLSVGREKRKEIIEFINEYGCKVESIDWNPLLEITLSHRTITDEQLFELWREQCQS